MVGRTVDEEEDPSIAFIGGETVVAAVGAVEVGAPELGWTVELAAVEDAAVVDPLRLLVTVDFEVGGTLLELDSVPLENSLVEEE